MPSDLTAPSLPGDASSYVSTPVEVPLSDPTTGADITGEIAPTGLNYPAPSNQWGGLDVLGSSVSNVAANIFTSAGNLIAAQVNNAALLTATGKRGSPQTKAPVTNPNAWHGWVLGGAAALAVGIGIFAFARSA